MHICILTYLETEQSHWAFHIFSKIGQLRDSHCNSWFHPNPPLCLGAEGKAVMNEIQPLPPWGCQLDGEANNYSTQYLWWEGGKGLQEKRTKICLFTASSWASSISYTERQERWGPCAEMPLCFDAHDPTLDSEFPAWCLSWLTRMLIPYLDCKLPKAKPHVTDILTTHTSLSNWLKNSRWSTNNFGCQGKESFKWTYYKVTVINALKDVKHAKALKKSESRCWR